MNTMALRLNLSSKMRKYENCFKMIQRSKSCTSNITKFKTQDSSKNASYGAIVGLYTGADGNAYFTETGKALNNLVGGQIMQNLRQARPFPKLGEVRIFDRLHPTYKSIAVVGLGDGYEGFSEKDKVDERKETIRYAAGLGIQKLSEIELDRILVESFGNTESAAEGSSLAAWKYKEKDDGKKKNTAKLELLDSCDKKNWLIGLHKAAAQNLVHHLQEFPDNILTPDIFAQYSVEVLSKYNINVDIRTKKWAKLRNMDAFLTACKGGYDPKFLEIFYEGCSRYSSPIVLIGKGIMSCSNVTNDKLCKRVDHTKSERDIVGAASVVATIRAVAALQLPMNIRGLIPLYSKSLEKSPMKLGGTVNSYSGKTIKIDSETCEGLLMHADALSYAAKYNPRLIVDIGTLKEAACASMDETASFVYSNNEGLYNMIKVASFHTGDKIWRLPLWEYFNEYKSSCDGVYNKIKLLDGGSAFKGVQFLREFVPSNCYWIHVDTQNPHKANLPYLRKEMSGGPTRTLIEFMEGLYNNEI